MLVALDAREMQEYLKGRLRDAVTGDRKEVTGSAESRIFLRICLHPWMALIRNHSILI